MDQIDIGWLFLEQNSRPRWINFVTTMGSATASFWRHASCRPCACAGTRDSTHSHTRAAADAPTRAPTRAPNESFQSLDL
eukprot:864025-Pleurochrysis_carterae.AAC.1